MPRAGGARGDQRRTALTGTQAQADAPLRRLHRYLATLRPGKAALWCYLIWYLTTVALHFDPTPAIWVNALGISAVVGIALQLSVARGTGPRDRWQTFRLFMMPFAVSSFSSLIKGRGYWLIVPPRLDEALVGIAGCAGFLLLTWVARRTALT